MAFSTAAQQRLLQRYGQWAVVTGASSGIGQALAGRLAEAGFSLILVARGRAALEGLQTDLAERFGTTAVVVAVDLSTAEGVAAVCETAADKAVGLLVASAGFGTSGAFLDGEAATETAMLVVNCTALMQLSHHFGRRFAAQERGGLVLLSSIVGFQGTPFAANYAATKAYVQVLAEGLHRELRPLGVDVLAAAPGPVKTGFGQRAHMKMGQALTPEAIALPILQALGRRQTVFPGALSKLLIYSLHLLPRHIRIRIMGSIMSGMHQPQA